MNKKFIVMAAFAAVFGMAFTACSNNDDDLAQAPAQTRGIGFEAKTDFSHVTRGYAMNATNVTTVLPDFQTWAYDDNTNVLYMGTSATVGRNVTNTSMDGSSWDYAPTQFWPVNPLNFVAIAPAAPNGVTGNSTASVSNVVTLTTNVTLSTNVEDQDDIMFAEADDIESTDYANNVPFTFKHALSQIVFKGKFDGEHAISKVTIAEIALGGVNKTGELVFTSAGQFYGGETQPATVSTPAVFSLDAGDLEASVWDENQVVTAGTKYTAEEIAAAEEGDDAYGKTTDDWKVEPVLLGTSSFDLTVSNNSTKKNAWMLIPQETAAWDGTSYTAAGVPTSGAYIKLRVKLESYNSATDSYVTIKNNAEEDAIYLPLAIDWDRSTKYIYTIEFNGDNALTPITFSVAAQDWTDADPQPGDISY